MMLLAYEKKGLPQQSDSQRQAWQLLYAYSQNYFIHHIQQIAQIQGQGELMAKIPIECLFKCINQGLYHCKNDGEITDLLTVLIRRGFGSNVIEVLLKITSKFQRSMLFDQIVLPFQGEIARLDPGNCYMADISGTKLDDGESICLRAGSSSVKMGRQEAEEAALGKLFEKRGPNYTLDISIEERADQKMYVSQQFHGTHRKYVLYVLFGPEQAISLYIQERGLAQGEPQQDSEWANQFAAEQAEGQAGKNPDNYKRTLTQFTSCLFKIQIQDAAQQLNHDHFLFYSFANDQNISAGLKNVISQKNLTNPKNLLINIWVIEN